MQTISLEKGFVFDLSWKTMAILAFLLWYINYREKSVFLIDFSTFEPPSSWKVSYEQLVDIMRAQNCFSEDSLTFLGRMLQQSGTGPSTAWPPGIMHIDIHV
jgi:3-ketoacyl-CoA synthase